MGPPKPPQPGKWQRIPWILGLAALFALADPATAAGGGNPLTMPDFTRGDAIPEGATHDWNLGATGARGWMFSDRMVTSDARQISITRVDPGSPAHGVLAVGDVILGREDDDVAWSESRVKSRESKSKVQSSKCRVRGAIFP